jgi:two-component system chemotaxis response regulator CheY
VGKRILVVDDAADIRLLVRLYVEAHGHAVVAEAADGRQAIEMAETHAPEVVVLDVMMPVMSGLDALPQIRTACPDAVIVMYSVLDPNASTDGLADDWICKGEPLDALTAAIG